jgi:hypothetical protein
VMFSAYDGSGRIPPHADCASIIYLYGRENKGRSTDHIKRNKHLIHNDDNNNNQRAGQCRIRCKAMHLLNLRIPHSSRKSPLPVLSIYSSLVGSSFHNLIVPSSDPVA